MMVRERHQQFQKTYGFASDTLHSIEYFDDGNARRTGPRPGNLVERLSPLVRLAMGAASLEGALARQASALPLLDSARQVHRMIILFHPRSTKPKNRRLPLSVLHLGAVLEGREEYEIVDGNADPIRGPRSTR